MVKEDDYFVRNKYYLNRTVSDLTSPLLKCVGGLMGLAGLLSADPSWTKIIGGAVLFYLGQEIDYRRENRQQAQRFNILEATINKTLVVDEAIKHEIERIIKS